MAPSNPEHDPGRVVLAIKRTSFLGAMDFTPELAAMLSVDVLVTPDKEPDDGRAGGRLVYIPLRVVDADSPDHPDRRWMCTVVINVGMDRTSGLLVGEWNACCVAMGARVGGKAEFGRAAGAAPAATIRFLPPP